jgi:glutamate synthase (ferredoxin)
VGIATQDPVLRQKYAGKPEHVINFMTFVAEELREIMAELGFRTVDEMVGRVDKLETRDAVTHWKARGLDLTEILHRPEVPEWIPIHCTQPQDHGLDKALDRVLVERCVRRSSSGEAVEVSLPIRNVNRHRRHDLSSEVSRRYGRDGLPAETIKLHFNGSRARASAPSSRRASR